METDAEKAVRVQLSVPSANADEEARLAARGPAVAPGWYPHPSMAATRQYWDGEKWTEHIAPADSAPVAPSPAAVVAPSGTAVATHKDEPSYAWTIALLPLLWLPLDYYALSGVQSDFTLVGFLAVTLTLVYLDVKRLKERGVHISSSWAFLVVPAYLIQRTKRAGSTPAIPIAWFVTFGISLLASATFAAPINFDGDLESQNIEEQLADQGYPELDVSCPSKTGHAGDIIACTVEDQLGTSGVLTVTLDSDTGYVWRMG